MHRIYLENRSIVICGDDGNTTAKKGDIPACVSSFKEGTSPECLYIKVPDPDNVYNTICGMFKEVEAAGGLVSDNDGRFLLIKRNGIWDLPKGHREAGEEMISTAVREVMEETGVTGLTPGGLLCITDHCYLRDGIWHLKHTWWYEMSHNGDEILYPQTEEGITETAWVPKSDIQGLIRDSYPSIKEVFRKAGF